MPPPTATTTSPPPLSALSTHLQTTTPQSPSPHPPHLHHLAQTIQHNLTHQHRWRALQLHTHSPLTGAPLPRPLLSGLPPTRLYTHPDEQDAWLAARAKGKDHVAELAPEREWVLPTHLHERWSVAGFAEVMGGLGVVPPEVEPEATATATGAGEEGRGKEGKGNPWRTTKRVLLATLDPDSTVVYYVVHDGVVKPRQN